MISDISLEKTERGVEKNQHLHELSSNNDLQKSLNISLKH